MTRQRVLKRVLRVSRSVMGDIKEEGVDAGSGRSKGSGESGLVVVKNQETRGHDASDGRAGESVRHPNVVVDALDGFGLRPRVL